MVWLEPERVTNLTDLCKNFGYNREWGIRYTSSDSTIMNNLGNPDALAWTTNKILTFMQTHGVSMYREDFNCDPFNFWDVGDAYEGANRRRVLGSQLKQGLILRADNTRTAISLYIEPVA
jgi:hypothetical protein